MQLVLLVISVLFAAAAGAVQAPANQHIKNMARALDVPRIRIDFRQQNISPFFGESMTWYGKLYYTKSGKFRIEYKPPRKQIIIGDGTSVWLWIATDNTVSVASYGKSVWNKFASYLESGIYDDYSVNENPGGCVVLTQRQRVPARPSGITLWIDEKSNFPGRIELKGASGDKTIFTIDAMRHPARLSRRLFKFTVPKNAVFLK